MKVLAWILCAFGGYFAKQVHPLILLAGGMVIGALIANACWLQVVRKERRS